MATLQAFTAPPGSTDFTGGAAIFANDFSSAVAGTIDGIWYYHTSDNEGANAGVQAHRTSDQTLLASESFATSGLNDNAWNLIPLDPVITYATPDEVVTLGIFYPNGMGFSYTDGLNDLTSGDLTVIRDTARFKNSGGTALGDFPSSNDTTVGFAVGIEFTPDANEEIFGTADVSLGGVTATGTGLRTVHGTGTASLGGVTATGVGKRTVHGVGTSSLGGVSVAGVGKRTVHGTGIPTIGVSATAIGKRTVYGVASVLLGGVVASGSNVPAVVETPGGWGQLVSIVREAADERKRLQTTPPQACPNDGEPLRAGRNGSLRCPFDGWEWPRDAGTEIR